MTIKVALFFGFCLLFLWEMKRFYFEPGKVRESFPLQARYLPQAYSDSTLRIVACCGLLLAVSTGLILLANGVPN